MRESTQIIVGKGTSGLIEIINSTYRASKVGLVVQDREIAREFIKISGAEITVKVFLLGEENTSDESVRFYVGIGNIGVIKEVKRLAKDKRYAFFPTVYDYRFLYNFDGVRTLPEFVYVDENKISNPDVDFYAQTYNALFQLYSESLFACAYESVFPYKNKGFMGVCLVAEKILKGESDKGEYFAENFRISVKLCNALFANNVQSLVTDKVAQKIGYTVGEQFVITFLCDILAMNFTKRAFRDILIPSQEIVCSVLDVDLLAIDGDILPNKEALATYARKIKRLTKLPDVDVKGIIKLIIQSTSADNPLFAIIKNKGFLEELIYERP